MENTGKTCSKCNEFKVNLCFPRTGRVCTSCIHALQTIINKRNLEKKRKELSQIKEKNYGKTNYGN